LTFTSSQGHITEAVKRFKKKNPQRDKKTKYQGFGSLRHGSSGRAPAAQARGPILPKKKKRRRRRRRILGV
jgi:hypothetical protein